MLLTPYLLLGLEPLNNTDSLDSLAFHTFTSIAVGLGGFTQDAPQTCGTGWVMIHLYEHGYDAFWYPHEDSDEADAEITTASDDRAVTHIAMIGYSLGGGEVRDVAASIKTKALGSV